MSWVSTSRSPPIASTAASSISPRAAGSVASARRDSMKAASALIFNPPLDLEGRGTARSAVEGRSRSEPSSRKNERWR
jgi:hypothetical protein